MNRFKKIVDAIAFAGAVCAGLSVVAMMALICADVFLRTFFNHPLIFSISVVQYILMPMAVLPGLPLTYASGIFPRIGGLDKASEKVRKVNSFVVMIIEIITFGLLTWFSFAQVRNAFSQKLGVDMGGFLGYTYPVYIVLPFGFVLTFIMVLLIRLKRDKGGKNDGDTAAKA